MGVVRCVLFASGGWSGDVGCVVFFEKAEGRCGVTGFEIADSELLPGTVAGLARGSGRCPDGGRRVVSMAAWRRSHPRPVQRVTPRDVLIWALQDPATIARYRADLYAVDGSSCLWWIGEQTLDGHGRFSLGRVDGRTVAVEAHRFGYALARGVECLERTGGLVHGCGNLPCQLVAGDHVHAPTRLTDGRAPGGRIFDETSIRQPWLRRVQLGCSQDTLW